MLNELQKRFRAGAHKVWENRWGWVVFILFAALCFVLFWDVGPILMGHWGPGDLSK